MFVKRLKENDLLMSLNAKIDMTDGAQFALTGLQAVDEKKLLAMSDEKALEFFRSGELAWVYCHLMSMGSMGGMVQRIGKLTGVDEPAEPEKSTTKRSRGRPKK